MGCLFAIHQGKDNVKPFSRFTGVPNVIIQLGFYLYRRFRSGKDKRAA
ncbi:MAG TPA: hypothetical protein VF779_10030 [Pyrinomonadaceae bacterium]